jgi:KDO2-lipid IV(A) lauroyltransferase
VLARAGLALMWLLRLLPLEVLARVGETFGMLLYAFGRERRQVCLSNLARCFPDMEGARRDALARRHFRAIGRSILERGLLWWSSRARLERLIVLKGQEHLPDAAGGPVILLAPHFVALDAGWTRLSCLMDMSSIYANQKNPVMNRALLDGRLRFGAQQLFSRQDGVREALKALKAGRFLYYLPDLDYGPRNAIFSPFFGVPAATVTALPRLARLADARVVPCVTRLLPGGAGYEVRCYPAWTGFPSGDVAADTRRMNQFIEDRVRECPEQYFWTHKRFKTRPPGEACWY